MSIWVPRGCFSFTRLAQSPNCLSASKATEVSSRDCRSFELWVKSNLGFARFWGEKWHETDKNPRRRRWFPCAETDVQSQTPGLVIPSRTSDRNKASTNLPPQGYSSEKNMKPMGAPGLERCQKKLLADSEDSNLCRWRSWMYPSAGTLFKHRFRNWMVSWVSNLQDCHLLHRSQKLDQLRDPHLGWKPMISDRIRFSAAGCFSFGVP